MSEYTEYFRKIPERGRVPGIYMQNGGFIPWKDTACRFSSDGKMFVSASGLPDGGTAVLPEGVTDIGANAFAGSHIGTVILPDTLLRIRKGAFRYSYVSCVKFPPRLTGISSYAFFGSHIRSAVLPESLRELSVSAFGRCLHLVSVTVLCGGTSCGDSVFASCPRIRAVSCSVPKHGGTYMFGNCVSLSSAFLYGAGELPFEFFTGTEIHSVFRQGSQFSAAEE